MTAIQFWLYIQTTMIIRNLLSARLARTHLQLNLTKHLSVHNYMKTFQSSSVTRHHGFFRVDEYQHYDRDQVSLKNFVQKEKSIYKTENAKWKPLTEEYYKISNSRRDARTSSISEIYDGYEYYTKVSWYKGREYTVIYRRSIEASGKEELVLDIMKYSQINRYWNTVELMKTSFSPSHRYVSFGVDLKNNEKKSFFIVDTHNSKKDFVKINAADKTVYKLDDLSDVIFVSETQIYYLEVENFRPHALIYHNLATGEVKQIIQSSDAQVYLNVHLSKDKKFLLLSGITKQNSQIWTIDLAGKRNDLVKIWESDTQVVVNHVDDCFVMWETGEKTSIKVFSDQQLVTARKQKTGSSLNTVNLKNAEAGTLFSCPQEETIIDIDFARGNIVLYMQRLNTPLLRVLSYAGALSQPETRCLTFSEAALPHKIGLISAGTNENYSADSVVFYLSTPFVYEEAYSFNLKDKTVSVLQKYEHTGPRFATEKYQIREVQVPSTTGDLIPLTIIGPKKIEPSKTLVHLYGFYGISTQVGYDNVSLAALEKGWTIAYAHVRGGGDKGKSWHRSALGENRDRTWKDLEECVGFLIKERYTHPSLLFLSSHSAGAIAVWNAINRKPHLYKGAIFKFPFLDVLSSLLDSSQPLSNTDYEEFGNPIENSRAYRQIEAISPYEGIRCIQYPAIHIVAGQNDYRTPVSQVAKFVSRLRDRALGNSRFEGLGIKGTTVDISENASHLGEASVKDENYRGCDAFGYMDFVIHSASKDCHLAADE